MLVKKDAKTIRKENVKNVTILSIFCLSVIFVSTLLFSGGGKDLAMGLEITFKLAIFLGIPLFIFITAR